MNRRQLVLVLLLVPMWGLAQTTAEQSPSRDERALKSPRAAIVYGENLVEGGDFDEAIAFMDRATARYPTDDRLLTLYGQALYESRQIKEAEDVFMRAMRLNPLNTVAKNYVDVIRGIKVARDSEQAQMFESVAWDKAGDVIVLAMGFFLGSMLSGAVRSFNERRVLSRSKRLFLIGQYNDFADNLEMQLGDNNLRPLRRSLAFMLEHKSLDDSIDILNRYVNTEDNLHTLTRMIRMNEKRKA